MKRTLLPLLGAAALLAGCSDSVPAKVPLFPSGDPTPSYSAVPTPQPTNPPTNQPTTTAPPPAVVAYTVPPRVTGHQAPACVARANGMLPDPACTPGSVGATDPAQVCTAFFQNQHRPNGTLAAKRAAMKAYHLADNQLGVIEYDHLIPLSLGGSNDVTNLWPEVSDQPGRGFRNSKDDVELRLWRAVCTDHRVALGDVQAAFARDWTAAEKFLGLSP